MSVRILSCLVVFVFISTLASAETADNHAKTTATPEASTPARQTGGDLEAFKNKSMDFFADVFAPLTKGFLTERFAADLPKAVDNAAAGNNVDISNILTPLFGTLNNTQFASLMDKLEKKVKSENEAAQAKDGTTDNKFMDLLELIKKYGKVILKDADKSSDKAKATSDQFEKDFLAQQQKNKDLRKLVEDINKAATPKEKEDLQKKLLSAMDPKAALAFLKGQGETGDEKNKQFARDLRAAIAQKSESGHNFIDVFHNGEAQRLHFGNVNPSSPAADKVFNTFASSHDGFAPTSIAATPHPTPAKNFQVIQVNGQDQQDGNAPAGFKFTPATPPPTPAQTTTPPTGQQPPPGQPPTGAAVSSAGVKGVLAKFGCIKCHPGTTFDGDTLDKLVMKKEGTDLKKPTDILKAIGSVKKMADLKGNAELINALNTWAAAQK